MDAEFFLDQLLYRSPPTTDITLDELQEAGTQRIRLLEACSSPAHSGAHEAFWALEPECQELLWRRSFDTIPTSWRNASASPDGASSDLKAVNPIPSKSHRLSAIERDVVSHCALRLTLCGEHEPHLGQWFMSAELCLLRWRLYNAIDPEMRLDLLRCFARYSDFARAEDFGQQGGAASAGDDTAASGAAPIASSAGTAASVSVCSEVEEYDVPWQAALTVVRGRSRRCVLRGGMLRLRLAEIAEPFLQFARAALEAALECTRAARPSLLRAEPRLAIVLDPVRHRLGAAALAHTRGGSSGIGGDGNGRFPPGTLDPGRVDFLATRTFPLCARVLQSSLRRTSHLRYYGRLQHRLFLKGAGLSLQDAINFWRDAFTRKPRAAAASFVPLSDAAFDRKFLYNVKHSYGAAGKCHDYAPYTCAQIHSGPGRQHAADRHGCPFKILSATTLRDTLRDSILETRRAAEWDGDSKLARALSGHAVDAACESIISTASAGGGVAACAACAAHFDLLHPGHRSGTDGISTAIANADAGASVDHGAAASAGSVHTNFVSPNHWHRASVLYRRKGTLNNAGMPQGRKRKRQRNSKYGTARYTDNDYGGEDDEDDEDDDSEDEDGDEDG